MRSSRFTDEQQVQAIRQVESGTPAVEVCRKIGITEQTFYRWKKQYTGLESNEVRELRQLREENARLKKIVAELSLDKAILQDVATKKWGGPR